VSAFIEIFSTTDGRSQSMQSGSEPWTGLRSTFGEFGDDCMTGACLTSNEVLYENRRDSRDCAGLVMRGMTAHLKQNHQC